MIDKVKGPSKCGLDLLIIVPAYIIPIQTTHFDDVVTTVTMQTVKMEQNICEVLCMCHTHFNSKYASDLKQSGQFLCL